MRRTVVLNVVGLSQSLMGSSTPRISQCAQRGSLCQIQPACPAVTCSAQADYLTGKTAAAHGIVGNGWYHRELAEVHFWKQSNHLIHSPKVWDELRQHDPAFTCAKLFWWYNMYSSADYSITPRPLYPADGRKVFDIYTWPFSVRAQIKKDLGEFPFPAFWGPAAGIDSRAFAADAASRWIAQSAQWIEEKFTPGLSLVYLPHLDYPLQRLGPNDPSIPSHLEKIDRIVGDLVDFFEKRSVQVLILSEYGITPVDTPIFLNRLFRQRGWLAIKDELGLELLDCGASKVFAVADHQAAHIYLNDPSLEGEVRALLERTGGVEQVWGAQAKIARGLNHDRAGDLIAIAASNAWFSYYYWLDDQVAPDFARTVDIHRKPGYDPVELFLDPAKAWIQLSIASKLLRKKLGFRMLMDVIPLDASLVRGSHGRPDGKPEDWPLLIRRQADARWPAGSVLRSTDVYAVIRDAVLS